MSAAVQRSPTSSPIGAPVNAVLNGSPSLTPLDGVDLSALNLNGSTVAVTRGNAFEGNVEAAKALLETALNGKPADARTAAAEELAQLAASSGCLAFLQATDLASSLSVALQANGKKDAGVRSGACGVVRELLKACGKEAELSLHSVFQFVLNLSGDKNKKIRTEALEVTQLFVGLVDKNASAYMVPILYTQACHLKDANTNRLKILSTWTQNASGPVQFQLADALPAVAGDIHSISPDTKKAAKEALTWLLATCANPDIRALNADIETGLSQLKKIEDTVHRLAGTTFIQSVDVPTLSVMSPILTNGLAQERRPACKRACARIIENMAKLVEEPRDLQAFSHKFLPLLEKARDNVADPEVREVCGKAIEIFLRKSDVTKSKTNEVDIKVCKKVLTSTVAPFMTKLTEADQTIVDMLFNHIASLLLALNDSRADEDSEWQAAVRPYLSMVLPEADAEKVVSQLLATALTFRVKEEVKEVIDAEELCNCDFSLAYGNKVLLKKTNLSLHRGFKYGLMGGNDCGKTSLMRAIAGHQIEGLPPADQLRTVFVETDIQGELSDLTVLDYMFEDALLKDCGTSREEMEKTLNSVGFCDGSPANTSTCVGSLSGGWKMKLALARAMLLNADILLLDEPTNHLDTYNVKWIQDYLLSLTDVTVMVVSHDVKLLNEVCDHIIHFQDLKLENFSGNLDKFVEVYPEAKCYFELVQSSKFTFKFPAPGKIPGITSKGKALMKMNNITFTYPGVEKPQLTGVTIQVALASRVGIVGVNGAGKSTMIRLLMGELEPNKGSGEVWKHPNCRVGYIAQHAFHHIESHLDVTCNEYIRWRYQTGDDREALVKVTSIITEAEIAQQNSVIEIPQFDPETDAKTTIKNTIERIFQTRRKNRKQNQDEFECQLKGKVGTDRIWVLRKVLEKNGWAKVVKQIDERIALRETQFARPLTTKNVQNHMENVGLESELSTYSKIGALSTGQKVKVVLGAALWNQPHILILDEPTNYLDRESLGALAGAIREFDGGVIMISHNSQFVDTLCPCIWHLENGTLNVKGDADWMREAQKIKISDKEVVESGEMVDRFGNTVTVKAAKKKNLSNKEKRERRRRRKIRAKQGLEPLSEDESDWEE